MNDTIKKYVVNGIAMGVILALGIAIGYGIGAKQAGQGLQQVGTNTYQAGWDAAKRRLAETGFYPTVGLTIASLAGTVQSVSGQAFTVKIRPMEPLADPALDIRTVKTDANTKFYRMVQKDPKVYQKEFEEFNRKIQQMGNKGVLNPTASPMPPQMIERKEATIADIKQGTSVTVAATGDIRNVKEIVATEVAIQESAQVPVPATAPLAPTSTRP